MPLLEHRDRLLQSLRQRNAQQTRIRSARRRFIHAVIVVAEGAGQELMADPVGGGGIDASGNAKFKVIGLFLRDRINAHFNTIGTELNLKYLDPSYHIRSVPASSDSVYCWNMARNAVRAAMAGNTEMLIGRWHGRFVYVPMALATRRRKEVDTYGDLWLSVIEATGQPVAFGQGVFLLDAEQFPAKSANNVESHSNKTDSLPMP